MDLSNPIGISDVAIRLLAATLIGGSVGLDRELHHKPAGVRTHALVSLGACLLIVVVARVLPISYEHVDAMSRVIQGIIAGVGFLGGGAILKSAVHEGEAVHGLTTAASIWVVACLGIACGTGQWIAAVLAAALTLIVLVLGGRIERAMKRRSESNAAP